MNAHLSNIVQTLIAKAQIVSFEAYKPHYPIETIALFQAANESRQYLTNEELAQIPPQSEKHKTLIAIAQQLRDRAPAIVDEARELLLHHEPELVQPGGGLYPAFRAEACWRDFWQFLRCITYGIAGAQTQYTSSEGLKAMEQLYRELEVPLGAMHFGLQQLKIVSLQQILGPKVAAPYFDPLIDALAQFKSE
jgi:Phycobilisome protein